MLSDTVFEITQQLKMALALNSGERSAVNEYDEALLNELGELANRLGEIYKALRLTELRDA